MSELSIEDRIHLLIENLILDGLDFPNDTSFERLGMDSLDKIELLMDIEDEFNIQIPDDVMELLDTVDEVITYIENITKLG